MIIILAAGHVPNIDSTGQVVCSPGLSRGSLCCLLGQLPEIMSRLLTRAGGGSAINKRTLLYHLLGWHATRSRTNHSANFTDQSAHSTPLRESRADIVFLTTVRYHTVIPLTSCHLSSRFHWSQKVKVSLAQCSLDISTNLCCFTHFIIRCNLSCYLKCK